MHGEGMGVAVGWRVEGVSGVGVGVGVGVSVGVSVGAGAGVGVGARARAGVVNGWSLGAVNAAAMCAFRVGAGGGSRLWRARAAFRSWVVMPRRRAMLTSCLTDSANLEARSNYRDWW